VRLPEFITFTGADQWTDVQHMRQLSARYPIEWGVLLSPSRQGVDNRYPGGDALSRLLWSELRLSAHLCGGHSRKVMEGDYLAKSSPVDLSVFQRVQVNYTEPTAAHIARLADGWGIRGIAQSRADTFPQDRTVDWLFDRSGGRGELPRTWPPNPGWLVGYAGGLSPDTVVEAIEQIDSIHPYWIDMETGVRTDDVFDLAKCEAVCRAVYSEAH
jgi:hypothetical protein